MTVYKLERADALLQAGQLEPGDQIQILPFPYQNYKEVVTELQKALDAMYGKDKRLEVFWHAYFYIYCRKPLTKG